MHALQSIARSIFQLSRRDREFLPFSLMLRDEIENFCLSVSCFETRMRIFSYNLMFRDESEIFCHQSRASRRDREFLSLGLILRDENENICLHSRASRREREQCWKNVLLLGDGFPYFYVWGGVGWKWKWLLEGWSTLNSDSVFWDFLQNHLSLYIYTDTLKSSNTHLTIKIWTCFKLFAFWIGKRQKKYLSSFGEIYFKLFEKSIWIRDQISCCLDVGQAGAMQGGGWGNEKEGDQHGDGGGQLGAGGHPGGGLGQLGGGILQCPCSSGKLSQS